MSETPPVAPPAPPVTPPTTNQPPTDWTSSFDADTKGYVQNKGFKDPGDVINSYRNFEKLQGVPQDRLLKLPESVSSPEMKAIWERLGMPKEAKDYKVEFPKELLTSDPKLQEWTEATFLKHNFTKAQADGFLKDYADRYGQSSTASVEAQKAAMAKMDADLKKEWGAAYDQNKNIADSAARTMGMSETEVRALGNAMGADKALKFLHKLGTATSEASFVPGRAASSGIMAPEQAQNKIHQLMGDKAFLDRLTTGDADAKKTWENAHSMAYPGEISV